MKSVIVFGVVALSVTLACCGSFTFHRSFRNGYPAPLNVSKEEAQWGTVFRNHSVIEGKVVRVTDGDTVTILDASKMQHKIRLLDIDAPESSQAFGQQSRQHLADMIAGQNVRVSWKERDQYGRVLGTIWVVPFVERNKPAPTPLNVNLKMVKDGYAWAYHYTKTPEFLAAMRQAKAEKRGLWVDAQALDPWAFRKGKKGGSGVAHASPAPAVPAAAPAGKADLSAYPRNMFNADGSVSEHWKKYHTHAKTGKIEYTAGNGPIAHRLPAPVNATWPETGYWLSTNSDKRHGAQCPNYRKTRGYPCGPADGKPCGICGGR